MVQKSNYLAYFYLALSVLGLILCMRETSYYATLDLGYIEANSRFWSDALVNHAGRSVTYDIVVMYLCVCVFMFVESRRLKMKYSWVFMILGYLTAIAFSFPLYMFFRQRKLLGDY